MIDYQIGDTVMYRTLTGSLRVCRVESREDNIKNGLPGFSAVMADGMSVWGYDSDVIRVVKAAK
jgi:hypothetical protein